MDRRCNECECWCHACWPKGKPLDRMILCPDCGNKRCPKASDHRNACTDSNESGQPGSIYVKWEGCGFDAAMSSGR